MAVLCDVQGMSVEGECLRHLFCQLEEQEGFAEKAEGRVRQFLKQLFSEDLSGGWQQALAKMDWMSFAEAIVRGLNARSHNTVILVDELALFVNALLQKDPKAAR